MSARRVIRGAMPNGGGRRVRGAMRPAVFDPNARDADGDGRVQDSTRFERPGLTSDFSDPDGRVRDGRGRLRPPGQRREGTTPLFENLIAGSKPMRSQATTGNAPRPTKSNAQRTLDQINKTASSEKFDASREYGDYETKFPKHEVDGMMRRDTADITKMREMMKGLIKEAKASGVQYDPLSRMSDADLQELWSTLNAMKEPETRAQFLAMMLADFELGIRKLGRDRAKSGPAPFEDPAKVNKILDNLKGRDLI